MCEHHELSHKMYATLLVAMLLILAACGNGGGGGTTSIATSTPRLAAKQILTFPNVGIDDSNPPDPALVSDQNEKEESSHEGHPHEADRGFSYIEGSLFPPPLGVLHDSTFC